MGDEPLSSPGGMVAAPSSGTPSSSGGDTPGPGLVSSSGELLSTDGLPSADGSVLVVVDCSSVESPSSLGGSVVVVVVPVTVSAMAASVVVVAGSVVVDSTTVVVGALVVVVSATVVGVSSVAVVVAGVVAVVPASSVGDGIVDSSLGAGVVVSVVPSLVGMVGAAGSFSPGTGGGSTVAPSSL